MITIPLWVFLILLILAAFIGGALGKWVIDKYSFWRRRRNNDRALKRYREQYTKQHPTFDD